MTCTCRTERRQPNAAPDAPYFPGIIRFAHTARVEVDRDCAEHGWQHVDNADPRLSLAANLRYGD